MVYNIKIVVNKYIHDEVSTRAHLPHQIQKKV